MKKPALFAFALILSVSAFSQSLSDAKKLIDNEQFDAATSMMLQLIAKEPANPVNYYYLADKLIIQDRTDSALMMLQKGSALDTANPYIKIGRAKELLNRGNAAEARAAAEKEPDNKELRLISEETSKNVAAAMQLIDQVVAVAPAKNPALYIECAEALIRYRNKNLERAKTLLERAGKIDQKNVEVNLLLGDIYTELNNGSLAAQYYNDALLLDPTSPRAIVSKGNLYYRSTNYQGAKESYDEAIKRNANYAPAYRGLGEAYFKLGKLEDAKASYKKYLELCSNSCSAEIRYAGFLFLSKDFSGALTMSSQVRQHCDPNNALPIRISAYAYYELKDYSKGLTEIEKLFETVPADRRNAKDYEYHGKLLIALNRDSAGIEMLRSAIGLDPSRAELPSELASAYMKMKNYPAAIQVYEEKKSSGKDLKVADFFNLGKCLYSVGRYTAADSAFIRVTEISPKYASGFLWRGKTNSQVDSMTITGLAKPFYEKYIELAEADSANASKYNSGLAEAYGYMAYWYSKKETKADDQFTLAFLRKKAALLLDPEEMKTVQSAIKQLEQKK